MFRQHAPKVDIIVVYFITLNFNKRQHCFMSAFLVYQFLIKLAAVVKTCSLLVLTIRNNLFDSKCVVQVQSNYHFYNLSEI